MLSYSLVVRVCLLQAVFTTSSKRCLQSPVKPNPEMYYDYRNCSVTVLDWSHFITDRCQEHFVQFEIQIMKGCNDTQSFITSKTVVRLDSNYISGRCSAYSMQCYARLRGQFKNQTWSDYSKWATITAKDHTMVEGTGKKRIIDPIIIIPFFRLCSEEQQNLSARTTKTSMYTKWSTANNSNQPRNIFPSHWWWSLQCQLQCWGNLL